MRSTKSVCASLFLATALVTTLFASCGGSSGSTGTDTGSDGSGGGDSGGGSAIVALLVGTWKSVCVTLTDGSVTGHIDSTVTFDGAGNATDIVNYYSDSSCSSLMGFVITNNDTYSVGSQTTASGMTAYEINATSHSWVTTQDGVVILSGSASPTLPYSIFSIVGGNTLYFAHEGGATPETRPTTLDLSVPWTRQ